MKNCVIVCPTHKGFFSADGLVNLRITSKTNPNIHKVFVLPQGLDVSYFEKNFPDWKLMYMPAKYFETHRDYNKMLLSCEFYELFLGYDYILICQDDAVVIKDISEISDKYDCIGAPWQEGIKLFGLFRVWVGNGGLSIRRVSRFISLTRYLFFIKYIKLNEDVIFSLLGKFFLLKIPSKLEAENYFIETTSSKVSVLPDIYGFHALNLYNPKLQELIYKRYNS